MSDLAGYGTRERLPQGTKSTHAPSQQEVVDCRGNVGLQKVGRVAGHGQEHPGDGQKDVGDDAGVLEVVGVHVAGCHCSNGQNGDGQQNSRFAGNICLAIKISDERRWASRQQKEDFEPGRGEICECILTWWGERVLKTYDKRDRYEGY